MNDCTKHRVLVVDDQPQVLRFIEIDLKLRGYEVFKAASGEEALALVRSDRPDIMLLDMVLPGINGLEVLRRLRAFSGMPVIAFSASHENHDAALRLGADDFIYKPFYPDEIGKRIGALLGPETTCVN